MESPDRPRLGAFFTSTKKGRLVLFAAFLAVLFLALPAVLKKKSPGKSASPEREGAGKDSRETEFPPSPTGFGDTLTLGQKYDALISRWGGDLSTTKADLEATRKELEAIRATLKEERSIQEREKKSFGEYLRQLKEGAARSVTPASSREQTPREGAPQGNEASRPAFQGNLRAIDFGGRRPDEKREPNTVRIPTASGGQATLLNGVFAPVTGEPSPVRMRLDSALIGPNKARIPLKDAYLIGKAIGDPNASRVSIQLEKFSYVKDSGESIESRALGYVVGEDGLEGVPGAYEWRAAEYVPLAMGTGALQGLSGALAQSQTTTTLNPLGGATTVLTGDSMKFAGYQAAGGASSKLGEIVAERMQEIRPAVSTPANRKLTVVFLEGLTLDGLDVKEIDYGKESDPFRGLDAHR